MSNNDYFTLAYKILSYLKYCYENGLPFDLDVLNANTLGISTVQFGQTLRMLTDDGYIKGLRFTPTKMGTLVSGYNELNITSDGLQYLAENSMMQKAYRVFKEVKDWLPLL